MVSLGDIWYDLKVGAIKLKSAFIGLFQQRPHSLSLYPPPPKIFVIECLTICNLRCGLCRLGAGQIERQGQMLSWDNFVTVANKIRSYAKHVYLFQWGEPLLHPRIFDMIEYARRFSKVCISTNGNLLTREKATRLIASGVDSIIFDFDGVDRDTYESFRHGGDFDKAQAGLLNLLEARHNLSGHNDIVLQFIVTCKNENQIPKVKALAKRLKVTLSLKSPYMLNVAMAREFLPSDPKWKRYEIIEDKLILKFNRWRCSEAWKTFYILVNGDVNPCCHDYNATLIMGNLLKQSFVDIWHGQSYRDFRKAFVKRKELPIMCQKYCNEVPYGG